MDTLRPDQFTLSTENPDTADVRALLQRHFDLMRAQSPEESCHVMAPDTLAVANVTLMGIRANGDLLALGALAQIGAQHGELKSMHTAAHARGQGLARRLLHALIAHAQSAGMTRVSLETGTAPDFAAARALYRAEGFEICAPFDSYEYDPLSVFMTRVIQGLHHQPCQVGCDG